MEIVSLFSPAAGRVIGDERKNRASRLDRSDRPRDRQQGAWWALLGLGFLLLAFFVSGPVLRWADAGAAVLDLGVLSLLLYGLVCGVATMICSWWLQRLLWYPFRAFGNSFHSHFNQLTSWQQLLLYFGVFFLLLFAFVACLWAVC